MTVTDHHEPTPEQVAAVSAALIRGIVQRSEMMSLADVERVLVIADYHRQNAPPAQQAEYDAAYRKFRAFRRFRRELDEIRTDGD